MIDPPWPQKKGGLRKVAPNQTRNLDYDTMPVKEIFALLDSEFQIDSEAPVVFLWAIDKFLHEAESEMKNRGYKLHSRIIWDKENGVAPAFTVRFSHEYLLWFYKSPMPKIAIAMQGKLPTVWREQARGHSQKPDLAYSCIEALYPESEKWDIFSRRNRTGWQAWGNEVGKLG